MEVFFGGMGFGDAFEWMGFDLGSRDEGEEKVGFAEKKLRLWGIEAIEAIEGIEAIDTIDAIDAIDTIDTIDTIDAIDAIEGVEGIV